MIRQLRAFAWLRWRLLINSVRGSKKRDTLEQASRILALAAPAALIALSLGSIVALAAASLLAGWTLASTSDPGIVAFVQITVRVIAAIVLVMVVVLPIGIGATPGARYSRVLLLPVSRRLLHFIDVVSNIGDPWVFAVLPALALMAVGLAAGGDIPASLWVALAGLGLAAVFITIGALVSSLVHWLMRDRRRAEMTTLLFILVVTGGSVLPQLFSSDLFPTRGRDEPDIQMPEFAGDSVERFDAWLPDWTRVLPTELYGRALVSATTRDERTVGLAVAALFLQAGIFYVASGAVHRRLLDGGEGQSRRRGGSAMRGLRTVPGVSPTVSAVALAQYSTAIRSVRGRLAILLPGPMMGWLAAAIARAPDEGEWISQLPMYTHMALAGALLFATLSILPILVNQFTTDRAGLTLQWLLPIDSRSLVRGKALGCLCLFGTALVISLPVTYFSTGGGSLTLWLAATLGGTATFIACTPVGAVLSALLPVFADLSKTGSAGNPHPAAMIAGMIAVGILAVPTILILIIGPQFGLTMTFVTMTLWCIVVLALAVPLLNAAANVVTARRENLYLTK